MGPAQRPDESFLIRSLRALGPEVCGDAPHSDYLYLLLCLAFLRLHDQDRWAQLTRHVPSSGDPGDARRLLQRVVPAVDGALGYPHLLSGLDAPTGRLRPRAFEPVRKVVELAAGLRPSDFGQLRAAFMREAVRAHAICTPASVTRTMVALLAGHATRGKVRVYDPYARFGELLAEFIQEAGDQAAVRVNIEHPHPAELRLAGMSLAAAGTRAELAMTPSPPPGGATFLLTNPPFGQRREPEWLRRCVASLAKDGRAAVLMPYNTGFAASGRAYDVRRDLVEHGAVLAVVALPPKMFPGTSIGVCAWLLRQPTGHPAPVQLVDARRLGRPPVTQALRVHVLDEADAATIGAIVTASEGQPGFSVLAVPEEIRARGYSPHPPEYQDRTLAPMPAGAALAELDALPEDLRTPSYTTGEDAGWPQHRLGDLWDIHSGVPTGSPKKAKSRARTAREAVPVVHPKHVCNGHIQAGGAQDADAATLEGYRLQTGDVLWVRTGAMGQTAIVWRSESGWLPHTNLLRLRVTETAKLEPAYLLAYLSQAAGKTNVAVAAELGITRETAGKWRNRFIRQRFAGLSDEPRPGVPRTITDAQIEEVVVRTLEEAPEGATHWSKRELARQAGLSPTTIHRIWRAFGLRPWLVEEFKLSTGPFLIDKVRDVVGLCLAPPANAAVFSVDEKPQIQALERTAPVLPMVPGTPERRSHDYERHGTVDLFAALNTATGTVIGKTSAQHAAQDFTGFLGEIDRRVEPGLAVHLICDNLSVHKAPAVKRWLLEHPRFQLHFTPTYSSWLNQAGRWFAELQRRRLDRGVFCSIDELTCALEQWIKFWNENAKPFKWTKTADQIIDAIGRYCERISGPGH